MGGGGACEPIDIDGIRNDDTANMRGLLGILLGRGRQNVIFKLRTVRGLKDDAFKRVFFLFLLGLQGRAGAGQTAGKALPCQQQPCRAQRAGQQRNAAQR